MKTVASILDGKGTEVWSIRPDALVYEALEVLAEHDVGALPVVDGDELVGIVSERDYARKVILLGRRSNEAKVREIMTSEVQTVSPDDKVERCMALMTGRRIRHLPVMEEGKMVGLVSIGDIVKAVISQQEEVIEQLERYITSG